MQQGYGFARPMTVSARFRVKSVSAGLVNLMVFHILNIFVAEKQKKDIYIFLILYYIPRVNGSTPAGKYENTVQ